MRRKQLSADTEGPIARLRERLLLTIRFVDCAEDFSSGAGTREVVQSAAQGGDLRTRRSEMLEATDGHQHQINLLRNLLAKD